MNVETYTRGGGGGGGGSTLILGSSLHLPSIPNRDITLQKYKEWETFVNIVYDDILDNKDEIKDKSIYIS